MRVIDKAVTEQLYRDAEQSVRKRAHFLLHASHDDKVQRLLIGLVSGSVVEPHYHELSHQWELFTVLEGELDIRLYDTQGAVVRQFIAGPRSGITLVEFNPGDIHSVECLSERALMLEVKEGPFDPAFAKASPAWADN
ncbi:WbuC family cupin fold metalloprotein [Pantoea eucrina]|uniref:WbuC family cupin fold metalloprotein n=1 Tax=Pantoea eucrina TaxID=472693 RepID=UPI00080F3CE4|nr:WbuC family cupin fold metalloprotein [Pantoea eucrina]